MVAALFPELPLTLKCWLWVSSAGPVPVSSWVVVSPVNLLITAWLPLWASGHLLAVSPAQSLPRDDGAMECPAPNPIIPRLPWRPVWLQFHCPSSSTELGVPSLPESED